MMSCPYGHMTTLCRQRGALVSVLIAAQLFACVETHPPPHADNDLPPLAAADELQNALERGMTSARGNPCLGISAAVHMPGHQVWTGSAGYSERGTPMSTRMLFDVGSVAKNLEAVLVLKLVEDGKLSLGDPISTWLPPLSNVRRDITVRQLLDHTSGVFNVFDNPRFPWVGTSIDRTRAWNLVEACDSFVSPAYYAPGEGQRYSSTNYLLLTKLAEAAASSPIEELLKEHVLRPHDLANTFVSMGEAPPAGFNIAHPWADVNGDGAMEDLSGLPVTWIASLTHPVIYSTPGDLVCWFDELFNQRSVLTDHSLAEMLSFPEVSDPSQREPVFGLGIADYSNILGVRSIGHAGSSIGYSAAVMYLPETKVSMAWTINTGESPAGISSELMMTTWRELSGVLHGE